MAVCTFFGHRYVPIEVKEVLWLSLVDLIENHNVDTFYVGHQGDFDSMVRKTLAKLKRQYPTLNYTVVLAYMPGRKTDEFLRDDIDTVYPEGLENTPPKFAISKRNFWMIERSDYVVTYVKHEVGGAAQFKKIAERKKKIIIDLINPKKEMK